MEPREGDVGSVRAARRLSAAREYGLSLRAAVAAHDEFGGRAARKPRELVEVQFIGCAPTLVARRTLTLLLARAAAGGQPGSPQRITKAEIRGSRRSNERISPLIDEVLSIRIQTAIISGRKRPAIAKTNIFEYIREEVGDEADAWIEYKLTTSCVNILMKSEVFAPINILILFNFKSRYALTLYERGCLLFGRRDPTWTVDLPTLRTALGVEPGRYKGWADLRINVLEAARREIEELVSSFSLSWTVIKSGGVVVAVELAFWAARDTHTAGPQKLGYVPQKLRFQPQKLG